MPVVDGEGLKGNGEDVICMRLSWLPMFTELGGERVIKGITRGWDSSSDEAATH